MKKVFPFGVPRSVSSFVFSAECALSPLGQRITAFFTYGMIMCSRTRSNFDKSSGFASITAMKY